jgi:hypothetical protein
MGHVFHPGHDEWHGQTVVVFLRGGRMVAGRWHEVQGGQLTMLDAAVLDASFSPGAPGAADTPPVETPAEWLARLKEYGIPVQHRELALPHAEVERVTRLRDA